jgi:hypothetical protein
MVSKFIKEEDRWKEDKRICNGCREYLKPECFGKRSLSFDGLHPSCKKCRGDSEKKYRENNPDSDWVINKYDTTLNTNHRYDKYGNRYCQDCRKHVSPSVFAKNYKYKDSLDKRCKICTIQRGIIYRKENKMRLNQKSKLAYLSNKQKFLSRNSLRRYLKKTNRGSSLVDFEKIRIRDNMMCYLCGEKIIDNIHFDHIDPISKGGLHTEDNIACTHSTCNLRKQDKTLLHYLLYSQLYPTWYSSMGNMR